MATARDPVRKLASDLHYRFLTDSLSWTTAVTSIPVTQIPVGHVVPGEADSAESTDRDHDLQDGQADTTQAESFAALLLQQQAVPAETPPVTLLTDVGELPETELITQVAAVADSAGTLDASLLEAAGTDPVDSAVLPDPTADLVGDDVDLEGLADTAVTPEATPDLTRVTEATPAFAQETSVPFAEELQSFAPQETLTTEVLEDPDAQTAELLEDSSRELDATLTGDGESVELSDSLLNDDAKPLVEATLPVEPEPTGNARRRSADPVAAAESVTSTATAANDQTGEAVAAVSLDSVSTQNVSTSDAFVPAPVPVHGLQKIVHELIVEAETVVDSKTIAVQFEEPHIGSVLIQMSDTDDGLTVSVAADDDLTLEMLQTGSQQLETTLKENNIELLEIASLPPDMSFTQHGQQDSPFQQSPDVYRQAVQNGQPRAAVGTPQRLTSSEQLNFRA